MSEAIAIKLHFCSTDFYRLILVNILVQNYVNVKLPSIIFSPAFSQLSLPLTAGRLTFPEEMEKGNKSQLVVLNNDWVECGNIYIC